MAGAGWAGLRRGEARMARMRARVERMEGLKAGWPQSKGEGELRALLIIMPACVVDGYRRRRTEGGDEERLFQADNSYRHTCNLARGAQDRGCRLAYLTDDLVVIMRITVQALQSETEQTVAASACVRPVRRCVRPPLGDTAAEL